jgi:hypothetical protein
MATWFEITFTGDPTDADRERAGVMVREGCTSGQLFNEPDEGDEMEPVDDAGLREHLAAEHPGIRQANAMYPEGRPAHDLAWAHSAKHERFPGSQTHVHKQAETS